MKLLVAGLSSNNGDHPYTPSLGFNGLTKPNLGRFSASLEHGETTDFGNKSHKYMNLQQTLGLNTKIGRIGITGKQRLT